MATECLETIASIEKLISDYDIVVGEEDQEDDIYIRECSKCGFRAKYIGRIVNNNLHGFGYYLQVGGSNYLYEGALYCNRIEGYGNITYGDCSYFEGLFKENKKFGPGIFTHKNRFQEVAWWNGSQMIRLIQCVLPDAIPMLKRNKKEKVIRKNESKNESNRLLKFLGNDNSILDKLPQLYNNNIRNPKSNFFNFELFDSEHSNEEEIRGKFNKCFRERIIGEVSETIVNEGVFSDVICDTFTPDELNLIKLRMKLRQYGGVCESSVGNFHSNDINDYCAVANSELLEDMAAHAFQHRDRTSSVRFSLRPFFDGLRSEFHDPGTNESACVAFLHRCAEGKTLDAARLFKRFDLNPDICDAKGNSGLLYATFYIRNNVIDMLCNYGADMNFFNDNGINPLVLAILKYLVVYHDLDDWNYAFLNLQDEDQKVAPEPEYDVDLSYREYCNSIFFESDQKFFFYDRQVKHVAAYETGEMEYNPVIANKFLFNMELVKRPKLKNRKEPKKKKPEPDSQHFTFEDEWRKFVLLDIFRLICDLLQLGADANIATFPMPPLFLSLFLDKPDLLVLLLEYDANASAIWKQDDMSALHVLVSQSKRIQMMHGMARILIEHGVDVSARTNPSHWSVEKPALIGKYTQEEIIDEGKTVLHILAMREDFDDDLELEFLLKLVETLTNSGASISAKYLGHTPLSLSVLRGNFEMVRILLECDAKADEILGYGMGKASAVYSLLRYENFLPDIKTCEMILDELMGKDDPLNPILEFANLIEFTQAQNESKPEKKNKKKEQKKKGKKLSARIMVNQYILKASYQLVLKQYQSIAFLNLLYRAKTSALADDDFSVKIVSFLSFQDAFDIVHKLVHLNFFDLNQEQVYSSILRVLQFVVSNGHTTRKERGMFTDEYVINKMNIVRMRYSLQKITVHFEQKVEKIREASFKSGEAVGPVFDEDFDKYKVCFECIQRSDRILLPCPGCGLVYFCSERCNVISKRKNEHHKCKLLFYKNEYGKFQRALRNGEQYAGENANRSKHGEELIKLINCHGAFDAYK